MRPGNLLTPRQILNQIPSRDDWYRIRNEHTASADIYLYDEIGIWGTTAGDFINEVKEITAPEIALHISSRGGDIFDGIAIYNALRTHPSRVVATVDSLAASIASGIAQAGDHRVMLTGSQMMIHEAWGLARGGAEHMRDSANILDKQTDNIAGIYAERAGGKKAHFLSLMKAETWMTPVEALKEGLIDDITKPELSQADTQKSNADWDAFLASCEIDGGRVSRPSKVDWDKFLASIEIEE